MPLLLATQLIARIFREPQCSLSRLPSPFSAVSTVLVMMMTMMIMSFKNTSHICHSSCGFAPSPTVTRDACGMLCGGCLACSLTSHCERMGTRVTRVPVEREREREGTGEQSKGWRRLPRRRFQNASLIYNTTPVMTTVRRVHKSPSACRTFSCDGFVFSLAYHPGLTEKSIARERVSISEQQRP